MNWEDIKQELLDKTEDNRVYFSERRDEILTFNLLAFKLLSVVSAVFLVAFVIITEMFMPGARVGLFHILLLVWIILHIFLAFYINKHRLRNKTIERAACASFGLCLYVLLICMDTVATPETGQIFCGAFMVIAPIVFIMTPSRMLCDELFFLIVYWIFAYKFKEPAIVLNDMYAMISGFFFGIIAYIITLDLRLRVNTQVVRFQRKSEIDELTKIKNRRAAKAEITYRLENREKGSKCAIMMMDVDHFKQINDTFGHQEGDRILVDVADALSKSFRKSDVVSRFGGDEFMVFIYGFDHEELLESKCQEIQNRIHEIKHGNGIVTCSLGLCVSASESHTMEEMFLVADEALYETKNRERGTYTIKSIG